MKSIALDGISLSLQDLIDIGEKRVMVSISDEAREKVKASRGVVDKIVADNQVVYGVTTGFGQFADVVIPSEQVEQLQPASIDSIPTSGNKEDHVSMGTISARKALEVVDNVETILAVELLAATQALEFLKPLKPAKPLAPVVNKIREYIPPWDKDRNMAIDILKMKNLIHDRAIAVLI